MKKHIITLLLVGFISYSQANTRKLLLNLAWDNSSEWILKGVSDPFAKQIVNFNVPLLINEDIDQAIKGTIQIIGEKKGIAIADTGFIRKSKGYLTQSTRDIKQKHLTSGASHLLDYADYIMDYVDSKKKPAKVEQKQDVTTIGDEFIYTSSRDESAKQDIIDSIKRMDDNIYFSRFNDYSFYGNYVSCKFVDNGLSAKTDNAEGFTDELVIKYEEITIPIRIDKMPELLPGITPEQMISNNDIKSAMIEIFAQSWDLQNVKIDKAYISELKGFKSAVFLLEGYDHDGGKYSGHLYVGFSKDRFYCFQYTPMRILEDNMSTLLAANYTNNYFRDLMSNMVFIDAKK